MAISKIKVNTVTLKKDTDLVTQSLKNIQKKIKAMQTDVDELNRMWSGDANEAFNETFQSDIDNLNKICNDIQSVINYEENAKTEYDTCEEKISELINTITI